MRQRIVLAGALTALSTAGCAQIVQSMYPELQPRSVVQIERSEFEPAVRVIGIEQVYPGSPFNRAFLRSWVEKETGAITHQLYVSNYYDGNWRFWARANSQEAEPLEFVQIASDVVACSGYGGCSYHESFGASIPHRALLDNSQGYRVKFYARDGSELVINVTPAQIAAQLAAIEKIGQHVKRRHLFRRQGGG